MKDIHKFIAITGVWDQILYVSDKAVFVAFTIAGVIAVSNYFRSKAK